MKSQLRVIREESFDFVLLFIMLYVLVYKSLGMPKFLPINFFLQQNQLIWHRWDYALRYLYFQL